VLFRPGERISAKDLILLRDLGIERVSVYEPFSAGCWLPVPRFTRRRPPISTRRCWPHSSVRGHSATIEGTVPTSTRERETVSRSWPTNTMWSSRPVETSVGKKDYVIRALEALGEVAFHRVRIRPGKTDRSRTTSDHDAVAFAIPGSQSAHTVATLVMRSLFFVGETEPVPTIDATLTSDVGVGTAGFEYAVPVTVDEGGTLSPWATLIPRSRCMRRRSIRVPPRAHVRREPTVSS